MASNRPDFKGDLRRMGYEKLLDVLNEQLCRHCRDCLWSSTRKKKIVESSPEETSRKRKVSVGRSDIPSHSPDGYSNHRRSSRTKPVERFDILLNDGIVRVSDCTTDGTTEKEKESIRLSAIRMKKFIYTEQVNGRSTNILQGLELHTDVFNREEQNTIVKHIYHLQRMGEEGRLRERTYSAPRKWMRGKGRVTIQFGCCYNYAMDRMGNQPGIMRDEEVDPLPSLFKKMIKRMVRWRILPVDTVPDSCIVNIYNEGDCIPPHIDHHDFLRPFCTVSFLAECNIIFGTSLKVVSAGEFAGSISIPLPLGSVLILSGNGADIAKHCVPSVPQKRVSITFRKMDSRKHPHKFCADPGLQGILPLDYSIRSVTENFSPVDRSPDRQTNYRSNGIAQNGYKRHSSNEH